MKEKIIFIIFLTISFLMLSLGGCIDSNDEINESLPFSTSEGLQGHWNFDEEIGLNESEQIILDSSENENHGIANGTIQNMPGKIGKQCVYFDGEDDFILIESAPSLEPQKLTVEAWVNASEPGAFNYIISKGGQQCYCASYALYTSTNGGISFYVSDGKQVINSPNLGSTIWDNKWHHIAGTYDGTTVRLYVDGIETGYGNQTNLTINYNLSNSDDLIIGNYIGTCRMPFSGSIDDILIWGKALSAEEIHNHYLYGCQPSTTYESDFTVVSLETAKSSLKTFLAPYSADDVLIIEGSGLNIQDRLVLASVSSQIDNVEKIKRINDKNVSKHVLDEYELIVLLGSEKSNTFSKQILEDSKFNESSSLLSSPFILQFGNSTYYNKEILVIYTVSERYNLKNYAAEKSPLNGIIDKKYIPLIATSASIFLLYIWSIIGNTISEFIFDFISEHITEKKIQKIKQRKFSSLQPEKNRNRFFQEVIAIVLGVLVFSFAMSWTWSEDISQFYTLFFINLVVICLIFVVRESTRIYLSKKYKLYTSHVFWPFGAVLTFGSTILGNTFSLASFTMLENEERKKLYGKMYFTIFLLLFMIGVVCFLLNYLFPSIALQMLSVFVMMSVVIDMTPIDPMDGCEVKQWNTKRWLIFYVIVVIFYILMNFCISIY